MGDFAVALDGGDFGGGQFHVAAAAGAVFDAHDDGGAAAFEQSLVAAERGAVNQLGGLGAEGLSFLDVLVEVFFSQEKRKAHVDT